MTEQTLAAPIDDQSPPDRGFSRYQSLLVALLALVQFTVDSRLHDHVAARRHHHAGARHHGWTVRGGGLGLCVQRRNLGHPQRGICRSLRPQAPAVVLLRRLHARDGAVRAGTELPRAVAGPNCNRGVRRRDRLRRARHHHRPVFNGTARPGDGLRANRVRGQPGAGHSGRAVSFQPLELARFVRRDHHPVDRNDGCGCMADAAGERPFKAQAGQDRVSAPDRNRGANALYHRVPGDDVAGDRRLHADAVRQRLHREQSRHRHPASADHLSGLGPVQHFHGPSRRKRQRCVRKISRCSRSAARCPLSWC